jgi:hypothetical protein
MTPRYDALWAEVRHRQKAIGRVWGPNVSFMTTHGGFFWDWGQPAAVLVCVGGEDKHSVHYDEELTLLHRAIDEEIRKVTQQPSFGADPTPSMDDSLKNIRNMNQAILMLVAAASDDQLWEQDFVQDAHARLFNINPLDRIVAATEDK